ncbi:class I SAM-dependent methyltransferase [Streptomyces sp. NBC_00328]|uniref:class I SAM-dependent methyltransferase n=1 Tax=Streptomyces sp. NBC_00328 TaxID=2903646 RepID=UPI002E2991DE|nr:class I SAM-dependent methyltransferase [Streptomyces sp. NBC_00328]
MTPSSSPSPSAPPGAPRHSAAARAHSFNAAAAAYAANRPSYPPALFDAVEALAGRSLSGAKVADVGAGTGISTGLLHSRGADVLAVEPGPGMADEFRRVHPRIPIVRGSGDALPLAAASMDFLTYAQSWHWTEPSRSVPEALRVLRPGGALALWWNTEALDVPWIEAAARRAERFLGLDEKDRKAEKSPSSATPEHPLAADPSGSLSFDHRQVRWSRRVPVDTHLANVGSHSQFLVLGEEATEAFFAEERNHLLQAFPEGFVEETYVVRLLVAIRS